MVQRFGPGSVIASEDDVLAWKQLWMAALKSWHSPYKCLVDCSELTITLADAATDAAITKALARTTKFFEGFFLRSIAGYGLKPGRGLEKLPFKVFDTEEEARSELGLRERGTIAAGSGDLRAAISIQNHFRQHAVEVSFNEPVSIDTEAALAVFKSKLTNNLTQWHSKWSLLIDCSNLTFAPSLHPSWANIEKFFRGFFMKEVVGYSPRGDKSQYPWETFRARHAAAGRLEGEGNFAGDEADCKSRKTTPSG